MPNTREKLIELIQSAVGGCAEYWAMVIADYLISNGVTISNLETVDKEWIPVEDEQKPKDRRDYFIAYVFGDSAMHFFGAAKYHAYEGNGLVDRPHFSNEGVNEMRVTHWMEIPKLPQKGE